MTGEYHQTAGKLPDALAFMPESRAEFWLEFREIDEPMSAIELEDDLDLSAATIYRSLNELEEYGLVAEEVVLEADCTQKQAYRPIDPAQRVAADGGQP